MNFTQFAISKFGNFVKRRDKYLEMRKKLRSAHIFKSYEEYVAEAIAISILVAVIGMILGLLAGIIITSKVTLPSLVTYDPTIGKILLFFAPYKIYTTIVIIALLSLIVLGGFVYSMFMVYPSLQSSVRKVKIDTQLPHAVMYMYALSRGETNIVEIIRSVADLSAVYGELSNEFAMVLRDMDLLGIDFMTALRNVQNETPSQNLNQFFGNLITLIDNGGDITDFFSMQIENFRSKTKSEHSLFLDMLGMIAEGYVTGFVAGPLFMIIVAVTLGSMKGSMTFLLMGLTYGVLPFGSIGFIMLIDIMLPKDEQIIGTLNMRKVKEFAGMRIADIPDDLEKEHFEEYERSKKRIRLENIMKDPFRSFLDEPVLSLYISAPAAVIALAIPVFSNSDILFQGYVRASEYFTNYVLLSVLILLLPYIIFYEIRSRKIWKIENSIPQFLKTLSIINETGLSLSESLRVILRTERGKLRKYIEKMYTDISWGSSITEAFLRFANTIRLNSLSRVVALITRASESSGDIRQVLEIASTDANINLQLKKDKFTNMLIYVIIIYITFLVFLYIVYTLGTTFLPEMGKAAGKGGGTFIKNFNLEFYNVYFYHTALIQGFFSGTMAGVMGEGDFRSGFKHSVVMMLIAFVVFQLAILE